MNNKRRATLAILSVALAGAGAIHIANSIGNDDGFDVSNAVLVGRSYQLLAPQSGTISATNLQPYSYVKKGQLALVINRDEYEARLRVALDQLERALIGRMDACRSYEIAETQRQSAQAAVDETESAHTRAVELQKQGFLSEQAVEAKSRLQRESQELLKERRLESAQSYSSAFRQLNNTGDVAQALSDLRLILASRSKYFVYMPDDAFVYGAVSQAGDTVAENTPLVRLVNVNPTHVEAYVLEVQVGKIAVGARAEVTFDSSGKQVYPATVVAVTPAVAATFAPVVRPNFDSNWIKVSQRVPVVLALNRMDVAARPPAVGTSASVRFLRASPGAATAPAAADAAPSAEPSQDNTVSNDVEKIARDVARRVLHNDATLGHASAGCTSQFTRLLNGRISG